MKRRIDIRGVIVENSYKFYYDYFGEESATPADVEAVLSVMNDGDELEVYVSSVGGMISAGSDIYTLLRSASEKYNVKIYVTGKAYSAASVIACAAYCEMAPTALMMVHCVSSQVSGNHNDMEQAAEMLQTADHAMCAAYTAKSGMTEEEALVMMESETWLNAEQAKEKGLIDAIMFEDPEEASLDMTMVAGPMFAVPTEEQLDKVRAIIGAKHTAEANASGAEETCRAQMQYYALKQSHVSVEENPQKGKVNNTMNKKKYLEMRAALMGEAQTLIDAGSIEDANAKMEEVKALDAQWEAIAEAQANMNALSDNQPALNVRDFRGVVINDALAGAGEAVQLGGLTTPVQQAPQTREEALKSDVYLSAWAKTMQHKPLTDAEADVFNMVNEYTHSTENTGVVIPTTTTQKIWSEIEDMYPYYADVTKTYVNGNLTLIRATATTDAAWYDEDTVTEDAQETIEDYTLTGCELARAISVTWKLKEMAMEDFLPYIQHRLAERMGAALGYGATNGAGKPGADDSFKPEPLGICTALKAQEGTPQVVEYTEGALTYADITKARGLIKSGYANGLKIYANSETIWNVLANVVDDNGRPIFINDQTAGGVYRVLGTVVVEDASLSDGQILFSNATRGYQMNINKQMSVMTEEHVKARITDYCAYAIVDGAPLTYKAHALLSVATAGE